MTTSLERIARDIKELQRQVKALGVESQLDASSVDGNGSIALLDENGDLKGLVGGQYDGTNTTSSFNGPIPPTPTEPSAFSRVAGAVLGWNGLFADGSVAPMDFSRVEVHASTDPAITGDLSTDIVGTFETPRGGTISINLPADNTTWYTRLVTRSESGKKSIASDVKDFVPGLVVGTDGLAPTSSPTPTIDGGVGSIAVSWDQTPNADLVTYEVHVSLVNGFTPDSTTFHSEIVGGGLQYIYSLPGTVDPLSYTTTYYVRLVAYDDDYLTAGKAPAGPQASGKPKQITGPDIAVNAVTADKIKANSITAEKLSAVVTTTGELYIGVAKRIALTPAAGLVIKGANGDTIFPTDLSDPQIAGNAQLSRATVFDYLRVLGTHASLEGKMTMTGAIQDPTNRPAVSQYWDQSSHAVALNSADYNIQMRFLEYDSTNWLVQYSSGRVGDNDIDPSVDQTSKVKKVLKSTGADNGSGFTLSGIPSGYKLLAGMTKVGSTIHFIGVLTADPTKYRIIVTDLSGAYQGFWAPGIAVNSISSNGSFIYLGVTANPILGSFVTTIWRTANNPTLNTTTPPSMSVSLTSSTGEAAYRADDLVVDSVNISSGNVRYCILDREAGKVRVYVGGSSVAESTANSWTSPPGEMMGAIAYSASDGRFYSGSGGMIPPNNITYTSQIWGHAKNIVATSHNIMYQWRDGVATVHTSAPSPTKTYVQPTRTPFKVTTDTIPGLGGTDEPDRSWIIIDGYRQPIPDTAGLTTGIYRELDASIGFGNYLTVSDFPLIGTNVGEFRSATGRIDFKGDDTWALPGLTESWQSYTPTLTAATTNPTNYVGTGAYLQVGKTIIARGSIVANASGFTAGSGAYSISLPVTAVGGPTQIGGQHEMFDASPSALYDGTARIVGGTATMQLYCDPTTAGAAKRAVTNAIPITWAANDTIRFLVIYQSV